MSQPVKSMHDVIIVGAGPAGATLGYELSRKGVDVLMLEKARLPRNKTCAGGITVRAANLLDFDFSPVICHVVYGVRVTYKNKAFTKWYDKPLINMVMRDEFDYLLTDKAKAAGAVVVDNQRVDRTEITAEGVKVITDQDVFKGKIVVGADGARSVVARSFGLMNGNEFGIGMEAEIPVSKEGLSQWDSLMELDLGYIRGGYGWIFPKKDLLSIGIGGSLHRAKKLKSCYQKLLASRNLESYQINRVRSSFLPVRRNGSPIQSNRSLLIGDAAGLLDPLTGEGICNAIRSAKIAAPVIVQCLQAGNTDLTGYQDVIDKELMPELKAARAVLRFFTWFPGLYFDTVRRSDRAWRAHCRLLRGEESYVSIKNKSWIFRFIFNLLD